MFFTVRYDLLKKIKTRLDTITAAPLKGVNYMDAPGKGLLKTVSILFIVFGAIATVISLVGIVGSAALASVGGVVGTAVGGILLVALVVMMIVSVLELILGIAGLRRSGDPSRANFFITWGIILSILSLIPLLIGAVNGGFQWTSLVGFVLPILYIVGGAMNRKAVTS